jgi:two-component system OmpR family response regulator
VTAQSGLRALVVEDEPQLAEVLVRTLSREGWQTKAALDGLGGVRLAAEFEPSVIVLDIGLPDIDGFEVLRRVRRADPLVCVLFLTARDAVEDRIVGIRAGGDDYVAKPFSTEEVLARMRGLVRRAGLGGGLAEDAMRVGDL